MVQLKNIKKMSKIPTAEEFLSVHVRNPDLTQNFRRIMIEFAKLHVIAALKSRDELYETYYSDEINFTHDNKDFIRKSYPLENIK